MSLLKKGMSVLLFCLIGVVAHASYILVPMDETQTDPLKSYGMTYWVLYHEIEAWW